MLGFIRRNIKTNNRTIKTNAYFTLVRPHLEYCSTVWNPHHREQVNKIEMVQRRAARYTMHDYRYNSSVTSMLQELGWKTLEDRRKAIDLVMMYKIVNNAVDIPTAPYIEYN